MKYNYNFKNILENNFKNNFKNESKKKDKQICLKPKRKNTNKKFRHKSYNTTPLESFLTKDQLIKLGLYDFK